MAQRETWEEIERDRDRVRSSLHPTTHSEHSDRKAHEAHLALAERYARLAERLEPNRRARGSRGAPSVGGLAEAIERALHHYGHAALTAYRTYAPLPEGFFKIVHGLYRLAEARELTNAPIPEPDGTRPITTIAHCYKHLLLMALSDPWHLPETGITRAAEYFDRFASGTQVFLPRDLAPQACQFLLDLDADRAGQIWSTGAPIPEPERFRLLDATVLVRLMRTHAERAERELRESRLGPPTGLPPLFFQEGGLEILRLLAIRWGLKPERLTVRASREREGMSAAVTVGLPAIHAMLNGEADGAADGHPAAPCDIVNESQEGMALVASPEFSEIRAGTLVLIRHDDAHLLASVRWTRRGPDGTHAFGVQYLARDPRPLWLCAEDHLDAPREAALLLSGVPAVRLPATIVASKGAFRAGRVLWLADGDLSSPITATKRGQRLTGCEHFEFLRGMLDRCSA